MKFFIGRKKKLTINEIDKGMIEGTKRSLDELDEHRINLWIALTKALNPNYVWKSLADHNGVIKEGWFLLGYRIKPGKQILYFIPIEYWDNTSHAKVRTRAPKHDGHTAEDITNRIKNLYTL